MFIKKSLIIILVILFSGIFAFSVSAEETATSSPEQATSTPAPAPEPVCSTDHLNLCATQELCEGISLYWYNDVCNLEPAPVLEPVSQPQPQPTPTPPPPSIVPEPTPLPPSEPAPQPTPTPPALPAPHIDPATAPSKVTIRVLMPDGTPPPFPVFVTFVGVGNKNFGGKINANGELKVVMPSGRYYTDLLVVNTEYVQGEDGPSFFLEANEERDFGVIRLMSKASQTQQKLEDSSLEANILAEAESTKGIGKILALIVKLLIKILEELRAIVQKLG